MYYHALFLLPYPSQLLLPNLFPFPQPLARELSFCYREPYLFSYQMITCKNSYLKLNHIQLITQFQKLKQRNLYIHVIHICYFNIFCITLCIIYTYFDLWILTFRSIHQRCSIKSLFLKISQNVQENTCARVYYEHFSLTACDTHQSKSVTENI